MNGCYPLNLLGAMEMSPRTARSCYLLLAVFEHIRSYPRSQPSKGAAVEDLCNELGLKTVMNVFKFIMKRLFSSKNLTYKLWDNLKQHRKHESLILIQYRYFLEA
jgi:uncharacterized membrane protein